MTTESTQSLPEPGPAPESAPVQSQGHRRRRRRRKNKSSQSGQQAAAPVQQSQQTAPLPLAPPPAPHPPRPAPAAQHQQGRKKKKFFPKAQATAPQPGNSIAPQGQGKRRSRQKGPREFVGPMDHSYRAVNGNVADGPPSTIPVGGGSGGYYADAYPSQQAAPLRHDAPARIFCFIEDLFFLAKIQESARKLGVKVEFVKGADKEAVARLGELPESNKAVLMVFDLNNAGAKPLTLIPKFKARYKKGVSIIGFLSHVQGELKMKASEAGCDTVMPRSAFSQSLPVLLRRYGVEEDEDEYAHQPA